MNRHCAILQAATAALLLAAAPPTVAAPAAPQVLVSQSGSRVTIDWSAVSGATGYTLYYAPYPAATPIGSLPLGPSTRLAVELWTGAAFYIAVRARGADGEGSWSNVASFSIDQRQLSALRAGDYWDYAWSRVSSTAAPGSTRNEAHSGRLRVTLGPGEIVAGRTAFPLVLSGDALNGRLPFAPPWRHVAADGQTLLGTRDGSTWHLLHGGPSPGWRGAGFFELMPAPLTRGAAASTFEGRYNSAAALALRRSGTTGGCTYYAEIGDTVCDGDFQSYVNTEYHKPGIGPVAARRTTSAGFSGGGFATTHRIEDLVELVATSLSASDGTVFAGSPWFEGPALPRAPIRPSCAAATGKLHVFSDDGNSASVQTFDPRQQAWSSAGSIAGGFRALAGDARVYGYSTRPVARKLLEYDPASQRVTELASLPFDDAPSGAALLPGGELVLLRSQTALGRIEVHLFQPATRRWSRGADLPNITTTAFGNSVAAIGSTVYFTGGRSQSPSSGVRIHAGTWRYDAVAARWSQAANLPTARMSIAGVALGGNYLALGGSNLGSDLQHRLADRYDPAADSWRALPPLPEARAGFCVAALDGRAYVVGGTESDGAAAAPTASLFVYEPQ